jgi:hypothetical protein
MPGQTPSPRTRQFLTLFAIFNILKASTTNMKARTSANTKKGHKKFHPAVHKAGDCKGCSINPGLGQEG